MNSKQYKLLLEELNQLCGTPEKDGSFTYRNLSFRALHGSDENFSWVDLLAQVMVLADDSAVDTMVSALSMNIEVMRKSVNPAWFGLSNHGPSIVMVQRFYGDALRGPDLLNYLSQIDDRCVELKQMITSALSS
jgi:hypothetical protein